MKFLIDGQWYSWRQLLAIAVIVGTGLYVTVAAMLAFCIGIDHVWTVMERRNRDKT